MTDRDVHDTDSPAALVLGASVKPDGAPSAALSRRVAHAASLYREGRVGRIVLSGGPPGAVPAEAEVMARLCREAGVPDAAILTETRAASTAENIRLSLPILRRERIARVILVTDRFHAPRAAAVARDAGLAVTLSCPAARIPPLRLLRLRLREALAMTLYRYMRRRGGC